MDVRLPAMDGFDATAALRTACPGIPVVLLTLYDDVATRQRARASGAAAFVLQARRRRGPARGAAPPARRAHPRVHAGVTVLAPKPTQLPFASQVDEVSGPADSPHVHLEVVDTAIPDQPNPNSGSDDC